MPLITDIPVVTSKETSNFPFMVETQNTENWNSICAKVTLAAAQVVASEIHGKYPQLPVRIKHSVGGMRIVDQAPVYAQQGTEAPYDKALWSGTKPPPKWGETVSLKLNGLGRGVVRGFAVLDGYLGLMIQLDEVSRPAWHKAQNPDNQPSLIYGFELA